MEREAETIGMVLAAHAASAILASRESEQLQSALSTRDRIGQAKGIIMERFKIDDVRAFEMLRKLSQDTDTKLLDVAHRVIDTRADDRTAARFPEEPPKKERGGGLGKKHEAARLHRAARQSDD